MCRILVIHFDVENLREEVKNLEKKTYEPDFWSDSESAQKVISKMKHAKSEVTLFDELITDIEDTEVLVEMVEESDDDDDYDELVKTLDNLEKRAHEFKINTLLSGEYDPMNAIISIHAGAGGTEAQDWADMLFRMYRRYAESKGYGVEILDVLKEEEAGIKSATLLIKGMNAYGYLKSEKGVHRLVRISPFDAAKKRHTSFASLDVYPELDDNVDVEINPSDLKIDTYRSSGPGGQHVNKTESAIRITHIPTGIVVQCQNERSQHKNRAIAMAILRSRIYEIEKKKHEEKMNTLEKEKKDIAWGSQIRSYTLHPYKLIKDHRTKTEIHNADSVLDGEIDPFIKAYLLYLTFGQKSDT